MQSMPYRLFGAGNRSRTGTILSYHGILSPGRLPIPPFRRPPVNNITQVAFCQGEKVKNFRFQVKFILGYLDFSGFYVIIIEGMSENDTIIHIKNERTSKWI